MLVTKGLPARTSGDMQVCARETLPERPSGPQLAERKLNVLAMYQEFCGTVFEPSRIERWKCSKPIIVVLRALSDKTAAQTDRFYSVLHEDEMQNTRNPLSVKLVGLSIINHIVGVLHKDTIEICDTLPTSVSGVSLSLIHI